MRRMINKKGQLWIKSLEDHIAQSGNETQVGGDLYVDGDLEVDVDTELKGDLSVGLATGTGANTSDVQIHGDLQVHKDITIDSLDNLVDSTNGNPVAIMENIKDSSGHNRFIEGTLTPLENPTGLTFSYLKWSLSGTHLIIVLAGTIEANTSITPFKFGGSLNNLPSWIYDKLIPYYSSYIGYFKYSLSTNGYAETSTINAYISKQDNTLYVRDTGSQLSFAATTYFRANIDLLIDNTTSE